MAFAVAVSLNLGFVIVEVVYGYWASSLALIADAGHNLSDVLALVLAWGAIWLSKRKPSAMYSYGLRSSSFLASLANSILLLVVTGGIIWESIDRLIHPTVVAANVMIWVAAIGIFVNGITATLFARGRNSDLNIRTAYFHMAADALISLAVVIGGLIIKYTGWTAIDPLLGLIVSFTIIASTWELLRESINYALHAVPTGISYEDVYRYLKSLKGVAKIHDLHIWGMSTTETAMTAHLICPSGHPGDAFLNRITHELATRFSIHHATLQIEIGDGAACALEPDEVV